MLSEVKHAYLTMARGAFSAAMVKFYVKLHFVSRLEVAKALNSFTTVSEFSKRNDLNTRAKRIKAFASSYSSDAISGKMITP